MICWQKHKKMMWSGWGSESLAQSEPDALSPASPEESTGRVSITSVFAFHLAFFSNYNSAPRLEKCTLPNLRAATSTGEHTEHYLKVWKQARKGLSKASTRGEWERIRGEKGSVVSDDWFVWNKNSFGPLLYKNGLWKSTKEEKVVKMIKLDSAAPLCLWLRYLCRSSRVSLSRVLPVSCWYTPLVSF